MENLEDAARSAADRWKARDTAKEEIRRLALELLKTKNMTETSNIIGISRTSLYYMLYGRDGKTQSARAAHEADLQLSAEVEYLRESA